MDLPRYKGMDETEIPANESECDQVVIFGTSIGQAEY